MIVAAGDHETLGIDQFEVGVEHLLIEPDRLDQGRDPRALRQPHPEQIDVLVLEGAPDGPSRFERHRGGRAVVWLDLL